MSKESTDHANVLLPPPALFGGALVLGLLIDWLFGWHLPMPVFARSLLAFILIGIGAVPIIAAILTLNQANTAVLPWHATRQIVTTGPFKFSRNPIYLGLVLVYVGLVILLGSGAGLVLLLPVLGVLHFGIVLREEAYLLGKFGEMYKNYCASTPRWLQ